MTVQAVWAWDTAWAPCAQEAAGDLNDCLDDLRELARLEDEIANPPTDRITDEARWYRMRQDAVTVIKQRWGAR